MFPVRACALVTCAMLLACGKSEPTAEPTPAPAAEKPAPVAEKPAPTAEVGPPFTLEVPPGYRPVRAEPPMLGAWETPPLSNGFVPTIRVTREKRVAGDSAAAFTAWKAVFLEGMAKGYKGSKILNEKPIEGAPVPAHLVVATGVLPVTVDGKEKPLPLYMFGAVYDVGDSLWVVAAVDSATLDVKSKNMTATHETALVASLSSFRPRLAPGKTP
jgi:hypothetical protein